jgi:hypothetical protein
MSQIIFFDPLEQFSIEVFQSYFSFFFQYCNLQQTSLSLLTVPSTSITKMVAFNFLLVML